MPAITSGLSMIVSVQDASFLNSRQKHWKYKIDKKHPSDSKLNQWDHKSWTNPYQTYFESEHARKQQ